MFGEKNQQYECTGNCYCLSEEEEEEEKSRRIISSTSKVSKGLKIFLTGFSVTMAYTLAKSTFQDHCVKTFEETCHQSYVQSEIEDCNPTTTTTTEDKKTEESIKNKEEEAEEKGYKRYTCEGHCVQTPTTSPDEMMEFGYDQIGPCGELKYKNFLTMEHHPDEPKEDYVNQARLQFALGPLSDYCRKESMLDWSSFPSTLKENLIGSLVDPSRIHDDSISMDIAFCIGGMLPVVSNGEIWVKSLENVDCFLIRDSTKEKYGC